MKIFEGSAKVLVTGGSGFIGSHLVDEIAKYGNDVSVLDIVEPHNPALCNFIKLDIRNIDEIEYQIENYDYIFHLAGVVGTSELFSLPEEAISVNNIGTIKLLEIAQKSRNLKNLICVNKNNSWNNIYSATMAFNEKAFMAYKEFFDLKGHLISLPTVYGIRQNSTKYLKMIPSFISKALSNDNIEIYGDGKYKVNLVAATDLVRALTTISALESDQSGLRKILMPPSHRIQVFDIAKKILTETGSLSKISFAERRMGESKTLNSEACTVCAKSLINLENSENFRLDECYEYYR